MSFDSLDWYAARVKNAASSAFITAPFGLDARFIDALGAPGPAFRYAIVDQRAADVQALEDKPNAWATTGAAFDHSLPSLPWKPESSNTVSSRVLFIHSKFMLIDALSENPLLVSGSANFSEPSTDSNDENMLVISGSTRLADIYLSEFMRLFTHFRFRYWSQHAPTIAAGLITPDDQGRVLKPDASWATDFYDPASRWCRERETFKAPPP